jgi:hypothetical protein
MLYQRLRDTVLLFYDSDTSYRTPVHLFFRPSEDKSRYSVYLHIFSAHKQRQNVHYLFIFSEGHSKFELLFTTEGGELLTRYSISYLVTSITPEKSIIIQRSQLLCCNEDFYC